MSFKLCRLDMEIYKGHKYELQCWLYKFLPTYHVQKGVFCIVFLNFEFIMLLFSVEGGKLSQSK